MHHLQRVFLQLSLLSLLIILPGSPVTANTESLGYHTYHLDFDNNPGFSITSSSGTPLLQLSYLSLFDFTLSNGNFDYANTSRQYLRYDSFAVSQQATDTYHLLVFSLRLDNNATLTISYYQYLTGQTIELGNQSFQVDEHILHVNYTVDNWPVSNPHIYLSLTSYISGKKTGYSATGANRTGWYTYSPAINMTANTVYKSNGSYWEYDDRWFAPTDPQLDQFSGTGANQTMFFNNYGIGLLAGQHVETDMFYTIGVQGISSLPLPTIIAAMAIMTLGAAAYLTFKKTPVPCFRRSTKDHDQGSLWLPPGALLLPAGHCPLQG